MAINWIAVFRSCFLVMFLAYPGVSLKVLRVFQCRTIDGVSYLEADMRLQVHHGPTPVPSLSPALCVGGCVNACARDCVFAVMCASFVQCFTSEWAGYAVYSLVMVAVYVVGLPLSE